MPRKPETRLVRGAGDNAPDQPVDGKKLLGFIKEIETISSHRDQLSQEISEIFANGKAIGYSNKMMRIIIRERKMDETKRREEAELLDLYRRAVGLENG